MAEERKTRTRKPARNTRKAPAKRRPAPKQKTKRVRRRLVSEFKPDNQNVSILKMIHFTEVQRYRMLRWLLYIGVCLLCLLLQDCIMSRVSVMGATTDLAVGAMLIIAVIEGSDVGSVFILIASTIYYFSGSAPGPYSVGMLSVLGLGASLFRQIAWHRSRSSILFCAGLAAVAYEIGLYAVGIFLGLTRWYRFPRFLVTAGLTLLAMYPIYHLIYRIGQIGGNTWKE